MLDLHPLLPAHVKWRQNLLHHPQSPPAKQSLSWGSPNCDVPCQADAQDRGDHLEPQAVQHVEALVHEDDDYYCMANRHHVSTAWTATHCMLSTNAAFKSQGVGWPQWAVEHASMCKSTMTSTPH